MNNEEASQLFLQPQSVSAAIAALTGNAVFVAGGTWVMRAGLRGESKDSVFVSLSRIPELRGIQDLGKTVRIGALVTHEGVVAGVDAMPEMGALAQAATHSANPAIRRVATVGGNICTHDFPASDLVPALIALNATVDVCASVGAQTLQIEDYISTRSARPPGEILTFVQIARQSGYSAHVRGLLRKAGEYPIVNVSTFVVVNSNRTITSARIAVGAVELAPRRWRGLERALVDQPFDAARVATIAQDHLEEFTPRDSVDATGWYRLRILPGLARQAFADIAQQMEEES